jgi:anti-sigma B factor antagonist
MEAYCASAIFRKVEAMHVLSAAPEALTTLTLSGQVDFSTRKTLQALIDAGMANGQRDFALDLHDVTSMDSSGLGALVTCLSTVRQQGGSLTLIQIPRQVQELIEMRQLTNFFNL